MEEKLQYCDTKEKLDAIEAEAKEIVEIDGAFFLKEEEVETDDDGRPLVHRIILTLLEEED